MEKATASTAAQKEAASKSKQEVGEPSREEDKGTDDEALQFVELEVVGSDDADTEEEEEDDGLVPLARWSNGLAAKLGNGGVILALVETHTGFAIFMYDGVNLLKEDALQNVWVDFADHTVAEKTAFLLEFLPFEHKASAISSNGVSAELAAMIRNHIEPGQKLAVENKVYQEVIQNSMEISCLCDDAVEELMWGLKVQMPYLVPSERSLLNQEDRFPISKGIEQLLKKHGFILEPDVMVTRQIVSLAGVARECDRFVQKQNYALRCAAGHLKRISRIDTQDWDLMKLATALKMVCYPEERIKGAPLLFPKRVLVRLKKDAPKYNGKILKEPLLIVYNEMYLACRGRSKVLGKLCGLLQQREKTQEVIVQLTECNGSLCAECNKRQNPPTLVPADVLGRFTCVSSHQLHSTNEPGILSMHIHPSKDVVATGGVDANAVLFDRPSGRILCTLTGHSKKVTTLKFVNGDELFITGSADKTVRIWRGSECGNYSCIHTLKDHTAEVAAVTVQASEKYFVSASMDNSWCLYDISTASCLSKVGEASSERKGYTSASFHQHGLLLGTGTSTAVVKLWDMKSKSHVANLKGHVGPVTAMSFSENGYLLATAALDGVKLWDVRKLRNLSTISPYHSGTPTNAVEFDPSGSYLGIGGSDARVYQVDKAESEWNIIKTLPDQGTGKVTSLKFGADTKYIAVGSMDCNLRIFGLPGDEQMDV